MYRKKYEIVKTLKKRLKNDSPMIRPSFSPPVNSAGRGKDDLIAIWLKNSQMSPNLILFYLYEQRVGIETRGYAELNLTCHLDFFSLDFLY